MGRVCDHDQLWGYEPAPDQWADLALSLELVSPGKPVKPCAKEQFKTGAKAVSSKIALPKGKR